MEDEYIILEESVIHSRFPRRIVVKAGLKVPLDSEPGQLKRIAKLITDKYSHSYDTVLTYIAKCPNDYSEGIYIFRSKWENESLDQKYRITYSLCRMDNDGFSYEVCDDYCMKTGISWKDLLHNHDYFK